MIEIQLTEEEVHSIIQALESERDQYGKEFGSSTLSIVREVSQRVIEQNNSLIGKLEAQIGEGIPF